MLESPLYRCNLKFKKIFEDVKGRINFIKKLFQASILIVNLTIFCLLNIFQ